MSKKSNSESISQKDIRIRIFLTDKIEKEIIGIWTLQFLKLMSFILFKSKKEIL